MYYTRKATRRISLAQRKSEKIYSISVKHFYAASRVQILSSYGKVGPYSSASMNRLCIIADSIDTQYAGMLTYAAMLIPALEATCPPDWEIIYVHRRSHPFFSGRREVILPSGWRYPGSDTVRRLLRLPALLRRLDVDVVHDLGHIAPFPRAREPYAKVLTVHDLTPLMEPSWHVRRSRWIHRWVFPGVLAKADHCITVSETTKRDLVRLFAPKVPITAIPLAAQVLPDCGRPPVLEPYILCVSTLEPRKNIPVLLRAFAELKIHHPDLHLVLVGKEGWHVEEVHGALAASPHRDHIHVTGYVPREELACWYAGALVVVYPSLYEGFGLPLLEAMAAGKPLVCSDIPSSREVCGEAALYVAPQDVHGFAETLHGLLANPERRARYAQAAVDRGRQFSWETTARSTWAVYTEVLRRRR